MAEANGTVAPESPVRLIAQEQRYFLAASYALTATTSFTLNSLVIFTFYNDRSLLIPSNLLILSITVSDWLVAILANPLGVATNASKVWALTSKTCVIYAFFTTFMGFTAIIHHTAIALERFVSLLYPYSVRMTRRRTLAVIAAIWLFSGIWSAFPIFGWSAYGRQEDNAVCSIRWKSSQPSNTTYVYSIFTFFYFLPILINVTAYIAIYRSVKRMAENAVSLWGRRAQQTLDVVRCKTKAAKYSFVMVCSFMIAWTPYAIVSIFAALGHAKKISPFAGAIPAVIAKSSTSYNPIIYFFMFNGFKESLRKSLYKVLRREDPKRDSTARENTQV